MPGIGQSPGGELTLSQVWGQQCLASENGSPETSSTPSRPQGLGFLPSGGTQGYLPGHQTS